MFHSFPINLISSFHAANDSRLSPFKDSVISSFLSLSLSCSPAPAQPTHFDFHFTRSTYCRYKYHLAITFLFVVFIFLSLSLSLSFFVPARDRNFVPRRDDDNFYVPRVYLTYVYPFSLPHFPLAFFFALSSLPDESVRVLVHTPHVQGGTEL